MVTIENLKIPLAGWNLVSITIQPSFRSEIKIRTLPEKIYFCINEDNWYVICLTGVYLRKRMYNLSCMFRYFVEPYKARLRIILLLKISFQLTNPI